ncbi:MAG: hypothetical protein MJ177_09105 [Clostridia bacterium]|nr:hypothetical protein [Clostridia bacterium]
MSESNEMTAYTEYEESSHRMGRFWIGFMLLVMFCLPLGICVIFKTKPDFSSGFWAAFIPILLADIPSGIGELIAYAPILGTGGTYLAFITGNLSNLKIPCAMNARKMAGTEIGTPENEVVSTISVAVSAITTTVVIAAGVLLISFITPILENPTFRPAFKTVIPAMFGALGLKYASDNPKAAVLPLTLGIVTFLIAPQLTSSVSIMVFVIAAVSIVGTFFLYKAGMFK